MAAFPKQGIESHDENACFELFHFFGSQAAAGGVGRVWEGFGKVLKGLRDLGRFGQVWEVWRVGGRVGTVYEDLGGFGKNWENLKGLGEFG